MLKCAWERRERREQVAIRAVVFDIGGVLEVTPSTGWVERWETDLGLERGELPRQLAEIWRAGSIGHITEAEVEGHTSEILGLDQTRLDAFMTDIWSEYLGTLNHELTAYFAGLRPRYLTALLSNSFVGAREREHARYGFADLCDIIIYSHEVGMSKPDPAIFTLTCTRLDVAPHEAIFVDDAPVCVDAARKFGMHAVQFYDNAQAIAEIEALLAAE